MSNNNNTCNNDTNTNTTTNNNELTLVLPLKLKDINRVILLIKTLKRLTINANIKEMLIFIPNNEFNDITSIINNNNNDIKNLIFPVNIINENELFEYYNVFNNNNNGNIRYPYSYAIQMAIKILASKRVSTTFYLTLDADLVLLNSFNINNIIINNKAIYYHEDRLSAHPEWWLGSEDILNINSNNEQHKKQGFGVTPSILSTEGSLMVINMIR
jgi:hypothetical protein